VRQPRKTDLIGSRLHSGAQILRFPLEIATDSFKLFRQFQTRNALCEAEAPLGLYAKLFHPMPWSIGNQ
jgi:hypothetical protein